MRPHLSSPCPRSTKCTATCLPAANKAIACQRFVFSHLPWHDGHSVTAHAISLRQAVHRDPARGAEPDTGFSQLVGNSSGAPYDERS